MEERFARILKSCEYDRSGLLWRVGQDEMSGRHWLQVNDGKWFGRKWFLSEHMTDSEVVQTLFKALLTWEEHECREHFRYLGQKVFDPHLHLGELAGAIREGRVQTDVRAK